MAVFPVNTRTQMSVKHSPATSAFKYYSVAVRCSSIDRAWWLNWHVAIEYLLAALLQAF